MLHALALVPLALGAALGTDYTATSTAWNGLGTLAGFAARSGCPVDAPAELDWSTLTGHDVLWLVYPHQLDGDKLERFLEAGGRVVVADDFGGSSDALSRLGLARHEEPAPGASLYRHNPSLPVAVARGETALSRATESFVTNHPAWFATSLPASFELAPGAAVVVEGSVGRGRFVALSDPSALINNMLELPGNRRFAGALVAATCRSGEDRVRLVAGDVPERGEPPPELAGAPSETLRERWNRALSSLGDSAPDAGMRLFATLVLVMLALFVFLRSLGGQLPSASGAWTRAPGPAPLGYDALVSRYATRELPWGNRLLAAVLREELVRRLSETLSVERPIGDLSTQELGERVTERHGAEAGRVATQLWRQVKHLPRDGQLAPLPDQRLQGMHRLATQLFHLMSDEN